MKRRTFFLIFFLGAFECVFAEFFRISNIDFKIDGKTKEAALLRAVEISCEKIFYSYDHLLSYAEDLKSQYENLRFAKELALNITYGEKEIRKFENPETQEITFYEIQLVTFTIFIKDSRHFLPIPAPKYDDNDGFSFKIKLKDKNFLGTLNELTAEVAVKRTKKDEGRSNEFGALAFESLFSYDFPFALKKVNAIWQNEYFLDAALDKNLSHPVETSLKTGLAFSLPFKRFSFDWNFAGKFAIENDFEKYGDAIFGIFVAQIDLPVIVAKIENWGKVFWIPSLGYESSFDFDGINTQNEDLSIFRLFFEHKIKTERINWQENFRNGKSFLAKNSFSFDFGKPDSLFAPKIEIDLKMFKAFKRVELATNIYFFHAVNEKTKIGNRLRGVRDKLYYSGTENYALKNEAAIVLNFDLPIYLFRTDFSGKFSHHINFEFQISPFLDFAIQKNSATNRIFSLKDGFYCAGLEILVFPLLWKGFVLRASLGFDLGASLFSRFWHSYDETWRKNSSIYELYIGFGFLY